MKKFINAPETITDEELMGLGLAHPGILDVDGHLVISKDLAGADRVFRLLDEVSEPDAGDVSLVNIKQDASVATVETDERTCQWAWKKGTEYIPVQGDVVFDDVDFG